MKSESHLVYRFVYGGGESSPPSFPPEVGLPNRIGSVAGVESTLLPLLLPRQQQHQPRAMRRTLPKATPTPMPIFALELRPLFCSAFLLSSSSLSNSSFVGGGGRLKESVGIGTTSESVFWKRIWIGLAVKAYHLRVWTEL